MCLRRPGRSCRPRRTPVSPDRQSQARVSGGGGVTAPSPLRSPSPLGATLPRHGASLLRPRKAFFKSDTFWALVVLSPSILAVLVFIYGFIVWTGYISLVNWNDVTPTYGFVGLQNFQRLFFQTPRFL